MSEKQDLLNFMLQLGEESGKVILPLFRKASLEVEVKAGAVWDPVTIADKNAEDVIRGHIEKQFPTHGIIGEEHGVKTGSSNYSWVIDPIDGTRAFVMGVPLWTTLIGLYRDGKPYLGLMNQPFVGESFYGGDGEAWNQTRFGKTALKVRPCENLQKAAAATTSPHLYKEPAKFERLRSSVTQMRYGGDAYFFSLLAAGQIDLALDAGLQIYDIAALIPIIESAGGVVGGWGGNDPTQGGNILAASSQQLLEAARAILE